MTAISHLLGKVHNVDCLEFMKQLPDKCVDLVLTDPPYGMNKGDWDKIPVYNIGEQCRRILKDNSAIYMCCGDNSYIQARAEIERFFSFQRSIIWEKENVYGGGDYLLAHEYVLYGKIGSPVVNECRQLTSAASMADNKQYGKQKSVIKTRGFNNTCFEYAGHPTQKPISLFSVFINTSTNKDFVIFDPFMGSGTTAVACERLGRKWFGCELDPKYCAIAEKRIEAERAQLKFDFK